jgi:hypothetical protein
MCWWQSEDGEALGQVFFQTRSELWRGESIQGQCFLDALLCGGESRAKEDAADGASDIDALDNPWDVSLSGLLEVELAAQHCQRTAPKTALRAAAEAALDKTLEEGAPVRLGLRSPNFLRERSSVSPLGLSCARLAPKE